MSSQNNIAFSFFTASHAFLVSQTTISHSLFKLKDSKDEVFVFDDILLTFTGNQGDAFRLAALVQANIHYMKKILDYRITPTLVANFIKNEIYSSLRTKTPYQTEAVVCSPAAAIKVDMYGALHSDNFVSTGFGAYFLLGLFDTTYSINMDLQSSTAFVHNCINTLKKQFSLETNDWRVDTLDLSGQLVSSEYINL